MIPALETSYAGCRFRSRLEARWAVFMDRLRVEWMYEPQGYLIDGKPYLPDFYLPKLDTFLEIKGKKPKATEEQDCYGLAKQLNCRVVIAYGDIPRDVDSYGVPTDRFDWMPMWEGECGDERYVWCYCPRCGCPGIEFDGRSERIRCEHHQPAGEAGQCKGAPLFNKTYTGRDDLVLAAYDAARSARFEHGESGAPDLPAPRAAVEERYLDPKREPKRIGELMAETLKAIGIPRSEES